MQKSWRSINDLYYSKPTQDQKQKSADTDEEQPEKKDDPEIRLVEGKWIAYSSGFQFNKKCTARVKVEFLKKTQRRKIMIKTFVEFDGEIENLGQDVEAFAEDDGIAETDVTLFYGEKFYQALKENLSAKCTYIFKAKSNVAADEIESEPLKMTGSAELPCVEINLEIDPHDISTCDDKYTLFSTDAQRTYSSTLTVKDDCVQGDIFTTLRFKDLHENLNYTLKIDPGADGQVYTLFENIPFKQLKD